LRDWSARCDARRDDQGRVNAVLQNSISAADLGAIFWYVWDLLVILNGVISIGVFILFACQQAME
jgi:hypothetical protein